MNFLILNGTNSNTIPGLIISSLPPITKPEMRVAIDEIDGKDGDQITKLGYSAYDKEIEIGLSYNYDVNQVLAFFNTEGIVTFSNEPDKYYRYTIVDQIDLEKLIRFKTAKVTMHVQPFKYELTEEEKEITTTETSFEGTNMQITGSEFGGLITNQKHKGQTEQKTYQGYNLLNIYERHPAGYTETVSGVTFTYNDDGSITANGTATEDVVYFLATNGQLGNDIFNGTNYLSGCTGGSLTTFFLQFWVDTIGRYQNATTEVATNKTAGVSWNIAIIIINGVTINKRFYPMMCATSGKSYEPYTGGEPSPNPSYPQEIKVVRGSQKITLMNKNLIEEIFKGYNINAKGQFETGGTSLDFDVQIARVVAGTTYTITPATNVIAYFDGKPTTASQSYNGAREVITNTNTLTPTRSGYIAIRTPATNTAQLEKGSTATSYVPHYEQEYELNLGKNLFNKDDVQIIHAWFLKTSTAISITSGNDTIVYIPCQPNTTYTASKIQEPNQSKNTLVLGTTTTQPTNNTPLNVKEGQQGGTITEVTITTGPNDHYLCAFCYSKADTNTYSETEILASLQIEEGSQATSYAPYFPPIELAEANDIRDEIYEANDKWYVKKKTGKKTLVGTETWTNNNTWDDNTGNNIIHCHTTAFTGIWLVGQRKYYSDQFIGTYEGNRNWNLEEMTCHTTNASLYIFVKRERLDGITPQSTNNEKQEALKRWLAVNKPTVWFALATPTDTEITYEPLIEQLNAIKDARLYDGITNIITEGNLPVIFSGKTYTTESTELTIENEGNIYARPKLTLTGIADISIYLNGSQIFILNLDREAPETIIIDCENMDAFYDGVLKNRKVTGDYSNFKLQPGNNQIAVSGSVAELKVETYSRWL